MSSSPPTRASQSRWIWPFELLDQIGEGGMGVVYRARYVVNGRHVALKMLPSDVTDETVLARFEREVEVLKNLKHPNIVRCFGGSCENKRRFYAMELVEGGTLEERLKEKGKLPWEQVIYYALQMCSALECSHGQGVVHRDIKPSNFLLTPAGQVKLSDFGLASVEASRKITAAGKTAGTFLYMAPEQIRGHEVTPQTDLYALGCVLYELLTGIPPFVSETPAATLHQHCHTPAPRVAEKCLDCPAELERIVARLLEKNASDRYASAIQVARELKLVTQTVKVAPTKNPIEESWNPHRAAAPPAPLPVSKKVAPPEKRTPTWILRLLICGLFLSLAWNVLGPNGSRAEATSERLWVDASSHENLFVRQVAVQSLREIAPHSAVVREALGECLQDIDPTIRKMAVEGLAAAGQQANGQLPQLMRTQQFDVDADVRNAATLAVSVIQAEGEGSLSGNSLWLLLAALVTGLGIGSAYWFRLWKVMQQEATAPVGKPISI